jgi:hypothetical protein
MLVFFIPNNLPDLAFRIFINPSGTFPETNLTISGGAGKVYRECGTLRWFGKRPGSLQKASANGQGSCAYRGDPDEIPAIRHATRKL